MVAVWLFSFASSSVAGAEPATVSDLPGAVILKRNGGWCWYQGPRAIVTSHEQLVLTSIAGDAGDESDAGDLWATTWDLKSNQLTHFELHDRFQRDDHNVAALLERSDGRILAVYGKHGADRLQRWRITARPHDTSQWSMEQQYDVGANYTYSNLMQLSAENDRIYNFSRSRGYNPNCTFSDDGGITWRDGWRLLRWNRNDLANDVRFTGVDGGRPYVRYSTDNQSRIHFVTTDDHPRAYDNSIYHGFYEAGKLHDSRGSVVGNPGREGASPLPPRSFTELFRGDQDHVAWTMDLELDQQGYPYTLFSVQTDGAPGRGRRDPRYGKDHRYYYGRWNGDRWLVSEIAYAGTSLYTQESDYTGLGALDPHDPNQVVISTNANPRTGEPLISKADGQRHWELFRGTTRDDGRTWSWSPITSDSTADNLRPNIPAWSGSQRLTLWTRGTLRSYTDYRLDVIALRDNRPATAR